jgi:hypothetical protein
MPRKPGTEGRERTTVGGRKGNKPTGQGSRRLLLHHRVAVAVLNRMVCMSAYLA